MPSLKELTDTLNAIRSTKIGRRYIFILQATVIALALVGIVMGPALLAFFEVAAVFMASLYVCSKLPADRLREELQRLERSRDIRDLLINVEGMLRRVTGTDQLMAAPGIHLDPVPLARPPARTTLGAIHAFFNPPARPKTFQERLDAINYEDEISNDYTCPILMGIMNDPVTLPSSGRTYDRQALANYARSKPGELTCPVTRKPIDRDHIVLVQTNITLKNQIEEFVAGKEREYMASLPAAVIAPAAPVRRRGWLSFFGGSSAAPSAPRVEPAHLAAPRR